MANIKKDIERYGEAVKAIESSPFESMDMLHRRSAIERENHRLTREERINLISHDLNLIKNAKRMSKHIGTIYDFSLSTEPLDFWWWHLDKVASDQITFSLVPVLEAINDSETKEKTIEERVHGKKES
ncbi:hypothetical protein M3649_19285 [Ureibacillus chungkukjangi]|uniref:hypothetical protein n=1 Tax=Ureibacillus chungkukjangi TaxID=1202712 RepID=UPI00203A87E4|nr:hypothetical protein [Ureibacillus chungkukjangi]MCM3390245.1 hypothetical protein [Ureibacillus chungkukjangi]